MLSNRLPRNHLARSIREPPDGMVTEWLRRMRGLMRPLRSTPNRFELRWLRQITERTATKDSSVADWVTTRSDLS